ncbi:MAG: Uncharacterised protein [SAR116 cluster bacterium]|jgi:sulfur carrier protein|nr:sulfur carrier protein ThiS [Alphaproteobacteria bacterium]CAI8318301.1 MAG: Uncharacterised protein [SAR116 cluster bacterium]|tara:strand:+ start:567 stop:764 length:198 start_codon:yes stop_codon:yes gene_type:complete
MKLQLNGTAVETKASTLAALLDDEGFGGAKVATAVNSEFVPEGMRGCHTLYDGDRVEVLAPMQGG